MQLFWEIVTRSLTSVHLLWQAARRSTSLNYLQILRRGP